MFAMFPCESFFQTCKKKSGNFPLVYLMENKSAFALAVNWRATHLNNDTNSSLRHNKRVTHVTIKGRGRGNSTVLFSLNEFVLPIWRRAYRVKGEVKDLIVRKTCNFCLTSILFVAKIMTSATYENIECWIIIVVQYYYSVVPLQDNNEFNTRVTNIGHTMTVISKSHRKCSLHWWQCFNETRRFGILFQEKSALNLITMWNPIWRVQSRFSLDQNATERIYKNRGFTYKKSNRQKIRTNNLFKEKYKFKSKVNRSQLIIYGSSIVQSSNMNLFLSYRCRRIFYEK